MDPCRSMIPSREPLPPQRWGFLPTEPFWNLAALTPISFVFWVVAIVIYDGIASFGWAWWVNGLGFMVLAAVWAGLLERWSRRYFARLQRRALTSPDCQLGEVRNELVPAGSPQRRLPIVATREFWDFAFERLFGRGKVVASMLFEFIFFMAAFYPSWQVFLGSFLVLVAISLGLGWWQRRLIRAQLETAQAGPALAEVAARPSLQPGDPSNTPV